MANSLLLKTLFAQNQKAKQFVRDYQKEHGEMPTVEQVSDAKALTEEEMAQVVYDEAVSELVAASSAERIADWEYIWNEETWNASYENGGLKAYYEWSDKANAPYKEDLWNVEKNRAANITDARKDPETGEYVLDENGNYIYDGCVRCWKGALNAPGAAYPWCCVDITPFAGNIKFNYDGGEDVFPWGDSTRVFKRTFAIASIPVELGMEYKLDAQGQTTFVPENLVVTIKQA